MLTTTTNPVLDFLKLSRAIQVKAHTRKGNNGTIENVRAYSRTEDDPAAVVLPDDTSDAPPVETEDRKQRELNLWLDWKNSGYSTDKLRPLLQSFMPLIRHRMNVYIGRVKMIPDSAIEIEFQLRAVDAFRTYDPSKGSLSTYVYRYLDKAKRFIAEHQNVGRIPENRIYNIRKYTSARDELADQLDREPTTKELASKLKWSEPEVARMEAEMRSDLTTQGFEDDPYALTPSKSEEVLRLFKFELEGDERKVYEYLTGYGAQQIFSTRDIAAKMGVPDYQVSRLKNSIQLKLRRYLED